VVVSGASGGLGSAVASALVGDGVPLLLLDREAPEELARSLAGEGGECLALAAELRDETSVLRALEQSERLLGPARHLVHCAAILRMAPIRTLESEEFRDVLDVNVVGAFVLARAIAVSASDGGGSLVLVSSTGGIVSGADSVAYGASKHALHGVMQGLAEAFAPAGVRVNAVCPGTMDTPLFGREVARDWDERFAGLTAEKKLADLCRFLLSRSTRGVTGQFFTAWGAPLGLA
jgi:NAD(P)-dependent dehydrogenase (short-subunit alcohol dehydrogenase family)